MLARAHFSVCKEMKNMCQTVQSKTNKVGTGWWCVSYDVLDSFQLSPSFTKAKKKTVLNPLCCSLSTVLWLSLKVLYRHITHYYLLNADTVIAFRYGLIHTTLQLCFPWKFVFFFLPVTVVNATGEIHHNVQFFIISH